MPLSATAHGSNRSGVHFALCLAALALAVAGQRDFIGTWAPWAWGISATLGVLLWRLLPADETPSEAAPASGRARRWLLLAGLVVYLAGLRELHADLASPSGGGLWAAGLALTAAAIGRSPGRTAVTPARAQTRPAIVALLFVIAVALRVYDLSVLPADVNNDESEHADSGLSIVHGQPLFPGTPAVPPSAFQTGWQTEPTGGHWLIGAVMQLAGEDRFGMRLTAALSGAIGVCLLYLLLREMAGAGPALAASLLMSFGHVHLFWSRTGFLQATVATLSTAVVWLVLRGLRDGRPAPFVVAGILLGLAQYVYWSARVLAALLALFAIYLLLAQWPLLRRRLAGLGLMATMSLLAVAPLALWTARNPDTLVARGRGVFVLAKAGYLASAHPGASTLGVVLRQLGTSLKGFAVTGDGSRAFYRAQVPLLDPVTAGLLLLGLAGFAFAWRRPERVLVALWLFVPLLVLCALTVDPPPTQRLLFVFPAFYVVVGLLLDRIGAVARAAGSGATALWRVTAVLLVVYAACWNHRVFFVDYRAMWPARLWTKIADAMVEAGPGTHTYLVSPPTLASANSTLRFLARGLVASDLLPDEIPVRERHGANALFIVSPAFSSSMTRLREVYPGGHAEQHRDALGAPLFAAYRVGAAELARMAGPLAPRRVASQRLGLIGSGPGRVRGPRGIAVDAAGRIYLADTGNRRVDVYAPDGTPEASFDASDSPNGSFTAPWSIAIAPRSDLVVLDRPRMALRRFSPGGVWIADISLASLGDPAALAILKDGRFIVADAKRGNLVVLSADNGERWIVGREGSGPGEFAEPTSLAVDADGSLYVGESGNQRLQHLSAGFQPLSQWALPPMRNRVPALAAAPGGGVWVAHAGLGAVHLYSANGDRIAAVGVEGSSPDTLLAVGALAVAPDGDVWALDITRQQAWRFRP